MIKSIWSLQQEPTYQTIILIREIRGESNRLYENVNRLNTNVVSLDKLLNKHLNDWYHGRP